MRFIKLKDVMMMTGLPRSSVYWAIAKGDFPTQIKVSTRSVVWLADEIEAWMENCIISRKNSEPSKQ